mmetsp:Transcript_14031/g.35849  ORF Transcript_14031/g.35849 Transcript_14031/m.35849 type:complete len:225 (+) Transcript_14031:149-823(+)
MTRMMGSVLDLRRCTHQPSASMRRPSASLRTALPSHFLRKCSTTASGSMPSMGALSFTISYSGREAFSALSVPPWMASSCSASAAATGASRPMCKSGSMTPPLPSPPMTAFTSSMTLATWISPTGVFTISHPYSFAMSSFTRDEDKFLTTGPRLPTWPSMNLTANASVYSSPMGFPVSSMRTHRSTSGSVATPKSALFFFTASHRSPKCSGMGSGMWENTPVVS